jgi:hypothetical protein
MILDHAYEIDAVFDYIKDKKTLLVPILCSPTLHASINSVCAIYIYTQDDIERIIPIQHTEQLTGFTEHLQRFLQLENIFVHDKKAWLQIGGNANVLDIKTLWWYTYGEAYNESHYPTSAHTFYWRRHPSLLKINNIVPLQQHLAMCQKIRHYAWPMCMNAKLDDSYLKFNSTYPEVYSQIESNGLCVTDEFRMPDIMTDNFVYSQYNYHTSTGRPSNAFRGFNYAAMNKEDGTRSAFVSRFERGALFEMDFDAYHVRLIAKLIGYELPADSIHTYFGKFYFDTKDLDADQYEQSKQITFRLLYGGIDKEFLEIPFFRKVNDFVYELWNKCKQRSYVETPILKRKIYKDSITNITANKLFNYYLQALETEVSTPKLQQVLEYLNGYESKLILYTYDSILLDVDYSEAKQILPEIINIMHRGKFPVKCKVGDIYSKMNSITL